MKKEFVTMVECPKCKKESQRVTTDGLYNYFEECSTCGYNKETLLEHDQRIDKEQKQAKKNLSEVVSKLPINKEVVK